MAITPYLAMTAVEIQNCTSLPGNIAWLSCHFSPYGKGLSNLPKDLPPESLLILDDSTPIMGHEPEQVAEELTSCIQRLRASGVLLDFQRPDNPETAALSRFLQKSLPCPVCVSDLYGQETQGPVFLPPVPPSIPLSAHLAPWQNREVWLDLGPVGEVLSLTDAGCETDIILSEDFPGDSFADETLHCHYSIAQTDEAVRFTLWRTEQDQLALLKAAAQLPISGAVGLYQELQPLS